MLKTLASLIVFSNLAAAADWPQFLGPHRNGTASESEPALPEKFTTEPPVTWEKEIGSGFAGPAVADQKVILFHREGDEIVIEALAAADGKLRRAAAQEFDSDSGTGTGNAGGPRNSRRWQGDG